jgi:hypothetical protein
MLLHCRAVCRAGALAYSRRALATASHAGPRAAAADGLLQRHSFPLLAAAAAVAVSVAVGTSMCVCEEDLHTGVEYESHQVVSNWSSTHSCNVRKLFEPKSPQEVLRVMQFYREHKMKLRPVGTALSPNGIGLTDSGADLLSLLRLDAVSIDRSAGTVTCGAGASVRKVLTALRAQGLTLENFSSIQEQQVAGWTQVAAHGTGCALPTVEEQIVQMKLATGEGLLTLDSGNPRLFALAKVGLGSLGVVTELTLRYVCYAMLCCGVLCCGVVCVL